MYRQLLDLIHYLNLELSSREQNDGSNLLKYFLDNDVYFLKAEGNQKGNTQSEENLHSQNFSGLSYIPWIKYTVAYCVFNLCQS